MGTKEKRDFGYFFFQEINLKRGRDTHFFPFYITVFAQANGFESVRTHNAFALFRNTNAAVMLRRCCRSVTCCNVSRRD